MREKEGRKREVEDNTDRGIFIFLPRFFLHFNQPISVHIC
jgi:hypothetical protein